MTTTSTFKVTLVHDGDEGAFDELFGQYLTEVDYPFIGDYGPGAWGGYDGPFVRALSVEREGNQLNHWEA